MYGKDLRSVWASIKRHPDLRDILIYRSNIDLKDKWRTMQRTHHGLPHNRGTNGVKRAAKGAALGPKLGIPATVRPKPGTRRRSDDAGTYIYNFSFGKGAKGRASAPNDGESSLSSFAAVSSSAS